MTLTGDSGVNFARGTWRIPRSRGAMTGLLLMVLGAWGALIPFIGPAFSFGFGGSQTWAWTAARFWLEVLPGIACFVGGLMLAGSANRGTTILGSWLAMAAGAWFVIGPTLVKPLHLGDLGVAMGGQTRVAWTWLLFFYGLGAVVLAVAATAHGRLTVRSVRDVEHAQLRAQNRQLARRGGTTGGFGKRGRGQEPVREQEPAREYAGADDRTDRSVRDAQAADRTTVYPTDSARADRVETADDSAITRSDAGRTVEPAYTPVDPSSTDNTGQAAATDPRARHQASGDGLGDRIGRTLARHGIGNKSRQ
jgi:hypothetical protein